MIELIIILVGMQIIVLPLMALPCLHIRYLLDEEHPDKTNDELDEIWMKECLFLWACLNVGVFIILWLLKSCNN